MSDNDPDKLPYLYEGDIRIAWYYKDQEGWKSSSGIDAVGRHMSLDSIYTPIGVKHNIESPLIERIVALRPQGGSKEDPLALEAEIRENTHLHQIVKDNLLLNLRLVTEEASAS